MKAGMWPVSWYDLKVMDHVSYWNDSMAKIPVDKDPSRYGEDKEPLFPADSLICDLGGGVGADSFYFIDHGHRVILVDISEYGLDVARQVAEMKGVAAKLETIQTDLSDGTIPLNDESVDVVYSRLALHYFSFDTTSDLFAEIERILRPGGAAYITLKSPDDQDEMSYLKEKHVEKATGEFAGGPVLKTRFNQDQLREICDRAGIENYVVETYIEDLGGRVDTVKSGNTEFVLNEVTIRKDG